MHFTRPRPQQWLCRTLECWTRNLCRTVSTTSAINRGLRATKNASEPERREHIRGRSTKEANQSYGNRFLRRENPERSGVPRNILRSASQPWTLGRWAKRTEIKDEREGASKPLPEAPLGRPLSARQPFRDPGRNLQNDAQRRTNNTKRNGVGNSLQIESDNIPIAIPYTTPASVFLYGTHTVYSALKAGRRKFYHLHYLNRSDGADAQSNEIQRLARHKEIPITKHNHAYILNKISEDRPHNGFVLEASPLPAPPVSSLGSWNTDDGTINFEVDHQTAEDEAINGTSTSIQSSMKWTNGKPARQPFVVMLEGITDPQNVGSILRTCYFYGVDAIAISVRTCAPLTSAALAKASSGACEAIPILAVNQPSAFVTNSAKAGWRLFAAVAPEKPSYQPQRPVARQNRHHTTESIAYSRPLTTKPCILMLGSESRGLSNSLRNKASDAVSIQSGRSPGATLQMGIDSVNVSVAAGALLESFLRSRNKVTKTGKDGDLGF